MKINTSGDDGGGDTPVPIPNTAVKPSSADGTCPEGDWESRTLPGGDFLSPNKFLFLENWITQVLLRINIEVQFVLIMMDEKRMEKEEKRSAFSDVVKLQRAHGGCLGARSRRRTQRTAISLGER